MKPETLYQHCRRGDEKAWTYVYNYLLAYLKKIETSESDAQDAAQETIRYYLDRGLECIRTPEAFKKMLRMKARALLLDQYRARKNKKELGEARLGEGGLDRFSHATPASGGNPGEMRIFLAQAVGIVRRSLAALDGECRRVLDIYFRARFLGVKMKETAKEMAVSSSAFRTKVHRCRQRLMGQPEYANLLAEYRGMGDEDSAA